MAGEQMWVCNLRWAASSKRLNPKQRPEYRPQWTACFVCFVLKHMKERWPKQLEPLHSRVVFISLRQTDHFPSKINYPDMKAGSQSKWRNRDSSSMWLSYTPSASPRMPRDIESHFCSWSSPPTLMTAIVLCSLPTPELHSLKCICCNLLHFYRSLFIGAIR